MLGKYLRLKKSQYEKMFEKVLQENLYMVFELLEGGEVLQIPTEKPLAEKEAR